MLVVDVLDHVEREEAHGKVVVTSDYACEYRDASHGEENVLHDLSSIHIYLFLVLLFSNIYLIIINISILFN